MKSLPSAALLSLYVLPHFLSSSIFLAAFSASLSKGYGSQFLCFLNRYAEERQTDPRSSEACSCADRWGMFSFTSLHFCGCLPPSSSLTHTQYTLIFFSCTWAQHFRDERKRTAEDRGWEAVKSRKYDPSSYCFCFFPLFFSWGASFGFVPVCPKANQSNNMRKGFLWL